MRADLARTYPFRIYPSDDFRISLARNSVILNPDQPDNFGMLRAFIRGLHAQRALKAD
jgi:hypothetical protein